MDPQIRRPHGRVALIMVTLCTLLAWLMPAASIQASPLRQVGPFVAELLAIADARTQGGSPDANFSAGFLWIGTENGHRVFVQFDLDELPVDATITSAELQLDFTGVYTGPRDVEVGRVDGAWVETDITWATQPNITWGGPVQTVDAEEVISWDVLPLVQAWHNGSQPNYGFSLRGLTGAENTLKAAHSKETAPGRGPKLVINYTLPPDPGGGRPDLGDAPDSTNHHNIVNTAYSAGAVAGQFPTVWAVPVGQVAGPRHANQTGEGYLGQYLSRENEADQGLDQDGPNNILRNAAGVVSDVSNRDRGDDGWRNRNIKFFDCRKQTLTVRISKAPAASLNRMYLNVWFDGNRDGDWQDINPCQPDNGGPAQASYEWIVQDHIIDMTAVPAGGFLDFQINTERVMNTTGGTPHWMRFTLSEAQAVQPDDSEFPDGRGPHPSTAPNGFEFGETEDVFQRPAPAGEQGELILEKRVLNANNPVPYGGIVTYEIRLRHVGGEQPIEAQIRDELDYPQHVLPQIVAANIVYVVTESPTGGVSPLEANLDYTSSAPPNQVITWHGTLAPNSEIRLSFEVHIHPLCGPILQTKTIHNLAQARPRNGDEITAEATFTAQCPGYEESSISFEANPNDLDLIDLAEVMQVHWQGQVWNQHPVPVELGLFQPAAGNNKVTAEAQPRLLQRITLQPDEKKEIDVTLEVANDTTNELNLPDDSSLTAILGFCILSGEDDICPDGAQYPNLIGQAPPLNFRPRPNELGDAPDSSNHTAGGLMTAYPGVEAHFPTVFDPATGLPEGPRHSRPRPFHLGPQVSREAEADIGPDQDGVNNINPPANAANQDWFDDGSRLTNLADCRPAAADVRVAISPQAVAWFQQQERKAYLNVWVDSNRDGDWEDGFTCQDGQGQNHNVVEHILIDYPIDVVALGAGLHNLNNIMTDRVAWPAQWAQARHWVRFTLSERPSNKTLQFNGITYGDGRGYPVPFRTGETEDHLWSPQGGEGDGPDVAVQLTGRVVRRVTQDTLETSQSATAMEETQVRFKIDLGNRGSQPAQNGVLTFHKPSQLQGVEAHLLLGQGIEPGDMSQTASDVRINLPDLGPGERRSIVLGLAAASGGPYTANVEVAVTGDVDVSNNSAEVTFAQPRETLVVGEVRGTISEMWRKRDLTCRDQLNIGVLGEAGQEVELLLDGTVVTTQSLPAGGLTQLLQNLDDGSHTIEARYVNGIVSPRDASSGLPTGKFRVDTSLPVDPMSLLFTDSQGNDIHPPTLGWSWGISNPGSFLRDGQNYEVSIDRCGDDPTLHISLLLANGNPILLHDNDGDGRFTGNFTFNATPRTTALAEDPQLRLVVTGHGVEQSFITALQPLTPGIVRNRQNNQPVAAASVLALASNGEAAFSLPAALSGSANPQTSAADGSYSFSTLTGIYRLDVAQNGYQAYHSGDVEVDDAALALDVSLTPAINTAANHIIYVTPQGFEPAVLTARPGDVIMWINADLAEHSTSAGGTWDSGLLASGAAYKIKLDTAGQYSYQDQADATNVGQIIVQSGNIGGDNKLFVPLVRR